MIRPSLLSLFLGLLLAAVPHAPGLAQGLGDLVAGSAPGAEVTLPAGQTQGRADVTADLVLRGVAGSVLVAPQDQAILTVQPGARLDLSGVTLQQSGQAEYAIFVDGGDLDLQDCRIEGAFQVAIYVGAGRLTMRDCQITGGTLGIQAAPGAEITLQRVTLSGQADSGLYADAAVLDLTDSTITDSGVNGLVALAAPRVRLDGVTVTGAVETGLWLQDSNEASLTRLVVQAQGLALGLSGGGLASLDGFHLTGGQGALVAEAAGGAVSLTRGKAEAGQGATVVVLRDLGGLALRDVQVLGGETGVYLTGRLPGANLARLAVLGQTGTGLFVDGIAPEGDELVLEDLRAVATGDALAAYFRDSGPVRLTRAAMLAAGTLAFAAEGASLPSLRDGLVISAPDPATGQRAYLTPQGQPVLLAEGDPWWRDDPAVGPGTLVLDLTGFVDRLAGLPEVQAAALEFAMGRPAPPPDLLPDLLLALEMVLPVALPPAVPLATIPLAPPEPGWQWDGAAVRLGLTGPDGQTHAATPADFPLRLPAGDYALTLDGRPAGQVTLADGQALTLPLPEAPFYAWRDAEGQKWRGPALYLRPTADLAALMAGFRPLRPGEYWGHAPQFAPRQGADRQLATDLIAAARQDLPAALQAMAKAQAAEDWPAFNRLWQQVRLTLDLMGVFAKASDAQWLLGLEVQDGVRIDQIETAVLIETRLGLLRDGAALPLARNLLAGIATAGEADRQRTTRLIEALARSGLPEASRMLADLLRALPDSPSLDPLGIVELSRLPPEVAGDLPARFLDRLEQTVRADLDGLLPPDSYPPLAPDLWNAAVAALAHQALQDPPDAPPRRLPVPVAAGIGSSTWAFADPAVVMLGPLAQIGPPDPQRLVGWTWRMPDHICAALAWRDPADRQALLARLRGQAIDSLGPMLLPADAETDPDQVNRHYASLSYVMDLILGECTLSDAVLNPQGRDAAGEEQAVFDKLDYEPQWWLRPTRGLAQLDWFAQGKEFPDLSGLSALPHETVQAALVPAPDDALRRLVLVRHLLLTDAFQSAFDQFGFGSERRQFRLRSDGGSGSITIAGYLDIRPILTDGRLILAIRHRILSPDHGGLAAMITEPDRAPYLADHRRLMFDSVTLDRGGIATPLGYEGTSSQGVHFFAAPWPGDLSDTAAHLTLRFVDTVWQVDLPLWASAAAHADRSGGMP